MTDPSSTISVAPLVIPATLETPDAERFLAFVRTANDMARADTGHADLDEDPLEVLGMWQASDDWVSLGWSAEREGALVGFGTLRFAAQDGTATADYDLVLDPARRGTGVEDALYDVLEREARARGFTTLQTWTLHRPGATGERIVPSTGWGSVPAHDLQTRFPLSRGYTLEQVERTSAFPLGGDLAGVERMLRAAEEFAGEDYRTIAWDGPTPEDRLAGFAHAISRMSTDAPHGGMEIEEQHWDADRVRRRDARVAAQGLTASVAAVEHVPTGTIAAFNELVIGDDPHGVTRQYGTLVLAEHRGRRLGTVVKCANLLRWRERHPESPLVSTFNAEENRHMLAINEAIGFVPVSYAGAWRKSLVPPAPPAADAGSADRNGSSGS